MFNQREIMSENQVLVIACTWDQPCSSGRARRGVRLQDTLRWILALFPPRTARHYRGVEVILQVDNPIYEGVAPVRRSDS